jgi:hypothetical protein
VKTAGRQENPRIESDCAGIGLEKPMARKLTPITDHPARPRVRPRRALTLADAVDGAERDVLAVLRRRLVDRLDAATCRCTRWPSWCGSSATSTSGRLTNGRRWAARTAPTTPVVTSRPAGTSRRCEARGPRRGASPGSFPPRGGSAAEGWPEGTPRLWRVPAPGPPSYLINTTIVTMAK